MSRATIPQDEIRGSADFFLAHTNLDLVSRGYGLTADSTKDPRVASIAAVGFALTAWVIAAERGYLAQPAVREMVRGMLHTLLRHVSHQRGFFAHFLHMESGERYRRCEFSTINTALCLNSVITTKTGSTA